MKTVVHPRNRGNGMLEPSDVPEKVADISDVAWSENEVSVASGSGQDAWKWHG